MRTGRHRYALNASTSSDSRPSVCVSGTGSIIGAVPAPSGDVDALALAAGEPHAPFADLAVVTVRQRRDEVVRVGGLRRTLDLLHARFETPVSDVLPNRAGEEDRLLDHQRDVVAECAHGEMAQIVAIECHAARTRIVEAGRQA